MTSFEIALKFTRKWEEGFVNHPSDPGGMTEDGISLRFLKDFAKKNNEWLKKLDVILPVSEETIKNLNDFQEDAIYKKAFWEPLKIDKLPIKIVVPIFDASVNSGQSRSITFLQEACNRIKRDPVLVIDGKIGPQTLQKVEDICKDGYETVLTLENIARRERFLKNLSTFKVFGKGWMNRIEDLRKYVKSL